MKFEDEAFVYLWQDGRQKPYRYYLGYHKGNPDDSYTHSSSVFESFSKYSIPVGVRRRVLATGSAEEMMELENKLLNNRKDSRKWDRYYNVIISFPPNMWEDPAYCEKMSESSKKQWEDPAYREMHSEKHTCTVCGFVALKRHIVRWHNDNCKHKNPLHELTEDDK